MVHVDYSWKRKFSSMRCKNRTEKSQNDFENKGPFYNKGPKSRPLRKRSFNPVSGHNYILYKLHNVSFSLFLSLKLPLRSKIKSNLHFEKNFYFNRLGILLLCLLISYMRSNAVCTFFFNFNSKSGQ